MRSLFIAILGAVGVWASSQNLVKFDSPEVVNRYGWQVGSPPPRDTKIEVVIAVKQQRVDELEQRLYAVSDPDNDDYGNFLTNEEVHNLVAPSRQSLNTVQTWLTSSGIASSRVTRLSPNGDFLQIEMTVEETEKLLRCRYATWTRISGSHKQSIVRVEGDYQVPSDVARHIDFVSPTNRFPPNNKPIVKAQQPNLGVSPPFLRELYNVGNAKGSAPGNSQGIASFLGEYFKDSDLEKFWKRFNVSPVNVTKKPPAQKKGSGAEAELDVQYITSMGDGISLQVYYTTGRSPDNNQNEPFLKFLTSVQNDPSPPKLFSISYGEDEKSMSLGYAQRVNQEFMKLGSKGITIFFAAGDSGAGGNCTGSRETPDWPSGSPYVTAVGGVTGGTAGKKPIGERVWSGGGGGFSDRWPRPSYQDAAITGYFQKANGRLPAEKNFNKSGRGYPDIAAQSLDFTIILNGFPVGVSGTSAASPTAAGVFSLLNDLRLQKNMQPLGFLNPLLYKLGAENNGVFNDCTEGANTGCGGKGFPAVAGWDAASGFGSPDYGALAKAVIQTGEKTKRL